MNEQHTKDKQALQFINELEQYLISFDDKQYIHASRQSSKEPYALRLLVYADDRKKKFVSDFYWPQIDRVIKQSKEEKDLYYKLISYHIFEALSSYRSFTYLS